MGAATGKLGQTGIGVVLHNNGGVVITMFSKHAGILDSSTAKVLAIPEVLRIFSCIFILARLWIAIQRMQFIGSRLHQLLYESFSSLF